jgi:uncharacterized membrane protein YphA (DoxX/SURF4 family)
MKFFPVIGRVLFAAPMLVFGFGHFGSAADMAGMVPSFLPAPELFVYLTGALLVTSALGIIAGFKVKELATILGIFLLSTAFLVWAPQLSSGGQAAFSSFMKDLGLAGAAFYIAYFGAGPMSMEAKDTE